MPIAYDILVASAAFNAAQLLTTALIYRRFFREAVPAPDSYVPSVTVIVASKGDSPDLIGNISSLLDQDYAGTREYLLVTPSRTDPGYQKLEALLKDRGAVQARLCASEALPSRSSGKALDLVFALKEFPPTT